jgi:L-asparaginase / beta-aspartyl-peptidase
VRRVNTPTRDADGIGTAYDARVTTTPWRVEPVLLVHGGAWDIPDGLRDEHIEGIRAALAAGWAVLSAGGSAVDAVEAAVVVLEDDEQWDAGYGSVLDQDGHVTVDAMIMDGSSLGLGSIAGASTVKNAVRVARRVMEHSEQTVFVGAGADRFAESHGFEPIPNESLIVDRERQEFERLRAHAGGGTVGAAGHGHGHDTVGAVALDAAGHLAAATSTGGRAFKPVGRVGDSPLVGSGGYADDELGAVSCTGDGESIMKLVLGKWAVDRIGEGMDPQEAAAAAMERLATRLRATGGLIVLAPDGRSGAAYSTPRMAWGRRDMRGEYATTS